MFWLVDTQAGTTRRAGTTLGHVAQAWGQNQNSVVHYALSSDVDREPGMGKRRERTEREIALMKEPGTIDRIVDFITSGAGFLGGWCQTRDVRYHSIYGWIHDDKVRLSAYTRALESRQHRLQEKVEGKLEVLIDADIRRAYDKKGNLLLPHRLPNDVAGATTEISRGGRGGDKIKMVAADRAVELAGRRLGLFREKVELEVTEGLGARLDAARRRAIERKVRTR